MNPPVPGKSNADPPAFLVARTHKHALCPLQDPQAQLADSAPVRAFWARPDVALSVAGSSSHFLCPYEATADDLAPKVAQLIDEAIAPA